MDDEASGRAGSTQHITQAVQALLDLHGITERKRMGVLQKATGLSYQSARRRLFNQANWAVDEVQLIAAYFGVPVTTIIEGSGEAAVMSLNGTDVPCRIWIGPNLGLAAMSPMVALPGEGQDPWRVVPAAEGRGRAAQSVKRLFFEAPAPKRIAVLDDDVELAQSISQFLGQKNLNAQAFATQDELSEAMRTTRFDGFVLDWIVDGTSIELLLATLRENQPTAPIIVLTGQMVSDNVSEDEVMGATTLHGAVLFEKPTRPLILVNALEAGFSATGRGMAA